MGHVRKHAGTNNYSLTYFEHAAYRKIANYYNCKFITLKYTNFPFSHLILYNK